MKKTLFLALSAVAMLAACSHKEEKQQPAQAAPTFHEVMKNEIDKHADEVWEVTNPAVGDKAGIDPAKMTDDMWKQLAEDATAVQEAANQIASMDPIVVTRPGGEPIADAGVPGGHSAAEVQAWIDENPQGLRDHAANLAANMRDLAAAANAHDAAKAGPIIDGLDSVCEGCHLDYWYPDQKALVEKIIKENK